MSHSPVLFESDDENEDASNDVICETTIDTPSAKPHPSCAKDEACVQNLRAILKGVPPPPNYTNLQVDVSNLLTKYYENSEALASFIEKASMETDDLSVPQQLSDMSVSPSIKSEESAPLAFEQNGIPDWLRNNFPFKVNKPLEKHPASHKLDFDVYYNFGIISEELASLMDKYRERYISCETNSSFVMRSPLLTASAKKRARRRAWGGYSPGRRLSHLAQRRRTFSSANLSLYSTNVNGRAILPGGSDNNKSAVSKKVIMVDMKSKNSQRAKSTSRIKDLSSRITKPSINNSKRALFQSPDQVTKNSGRKERTLKTTPNKWRFSKRTLWPSSDKKKKQSAKKVTPKKTVIEDSDEEGSEEVFNVNGKRLLSTSDVGQTRKKCQKSLNFNADVKMSTDEETEKKQVAEPASSRPQQCSPMLSQLHKQKMVWAVASSLKQYGINANHELFRPVGTVLFKKCRQIWLHKLNHQKSEIKRSTSEQMFEIAVKYASEMINKVKSVSNSTNASTSLSTENFVNISSVSCEEKSKSGFSKVSDIFFNSVKNSQSSQEDSSSKVAGKSTSSSVQQSTEITDTNSNSHSHMSSEVNFSVSLVRDEKSTEESNPEFSNSTTDDSIETNLRSMFDGCVNSSVKFSVASDSPMDLPKIFDEESQMSSNVSSSKLNLSIDKLSSDSAFNKPVITDDQESAFNKPVTTDDRESENVDRSLRNMVKNLKTEVESLSENDSGFIDNESTSKSSKSFSIKVSKSEIQSPTTFTATVSQESLTVKSSINEIQSPTIFNTIVSNESSSKSEKENNPLICVTPVANTESATFRFKKFGTSAENIEPLTEQDSNCNNSSVVSSAHFDETAMSSCDISVTES